MGHNQLIKKVEEAHEGSVLAMSVDADEKGGTMVTGSSDNTAAIWEFTWGLKTKPPGPGYPSIEWKVDVVRKEIFRGHVASVLDVALAKDTIVTCSKDTSIRIYDRHTYDLIRVANNLHTGPVNCLALHPDPNIPQFVSASGDGSWVMSHMAYPMVIARHASDDTHALACIAWKGPFVVTGSKDADIQVYTSEGYHRRTFNGHMEAVRAVDLDINEAGEGMVVSASYDCAVRMWDIQTGKSRHQFPALHSSIVLDVQFTNGRMVT
jgi:F-box and WD-40 domain protein 1/11